MNFKKFATTVALLVTVCTSASADIIGNDAIDRQYSDSWSNFVLGMKTSAFQAPGTVTDWEVYTANAGTLGMLVLRHSFGNDYEVVSADFRNANAGLNTFSYDVDTGTANVLNGDILGLFIGTSKIEFDRIDDNVNWCGSNGCVTSTNDLEAGDIVSLTGGFDDNGTRTYSANVTVPEPMTLGLLGLGLFFTGLTKRQNRNRTV